MQRFLKVSETWVSFTNKFIRIFLYCCSLKAKFLRFRLQYVLLLFLYPNLRNFKKLQKESCASLWSLLMTSGLGTVGSIRAETLPELIGHLNYLAAGAQQGLHFRNLKSTSAYPSRWGKITRKTSIEKSTITSTGHTSASPEWNKMILSTNIK